MSLQTIRNFGVSGNLGPKDQFYLDYDSQSAKNFPVS